MYYPGPITTHMQISTMPLSHVLEKSQHGEITPPPVVYRLVKADRPPKNWCEELDVGDKRGLCAYSTSNNIWQLSQV